MDFGPLLKKRKVTKVTTESVLDQSKGGHSKLLDLLYESWAWGQVSPQFVESVVSAAIADLDAGSTELWREHTEPAQAQNAHRKLTPAFMAQISFYHFCIKQTMKHSSGVLYCVWFKQALLPGCGSSHQSYTYHSPVKSMWILSTGMKATRKNIVLFTWSCHTNSSRLYSPTIGTRGKPA